MGQIKVSIPDMEDYEFLKKIGETEACGTDFADLAELVNEESDSYYRDSNRCYLVDRGYGDIELINRQGKWVRHLSLREKTKNYPLFRVSLDLGDYFNSIIDRAYEEDGKLMVKLGRFPTNYLGSPYNSKLADNLEAALKNEDFIKTGRTYYASPFSNGVEFELDGLYLTRFEERTIYFDNFMTGSYHCILNVNGKPKRVSTSSTHWFKVDELEWIIDPIRKRLISKKCIYGNESIYEHNILYVSLGCVETAIKSEFDKPKEKDESYKKYIKEYFNNN